jgi:RNA polymerase sigma factor for flagellar operon FliA
VDPELQELVRDHMHLASLIAAKVYKTAPHALELDELRSIAYLGLVGAAERWRPYCEENGFDPKRLEYFKPFITRRVNGAVMDHLRSSDWATRSLRSRSKLLQEAGLGQGVSTEELASKTGLSVKQVTDTLRDLARRPVSLEAEELDVDSDTTVENTSAGNSLLEVVRVTVLSLDQDCQTVLALHYYLGRELKAVAAQLQITESRASQLHTRGVLAVREALLRAAQDQGQVDLGQVLE